MNFPLQKLEAHLDEESLIGGENLLEQGAVGRLFELEKHLWLANVEGYEVEVQISPSKVTGGTCECAEFLEKGLCRHLAAVLLKLRRKQQARKEKREKAQKAAPSSSRRLTTGIVLDNVELEELIEFVRDFARTNRNFAIALKARFASSVSEIHGKDKYLQLLESTIGAVRKPDRSITIRGSQRLLKVLEELHQHLSQSMLEADFVEAANIAWSIIEKVTPIIRKARDKQQELTGHVRNAFESLRQMVDRKPAPSLLKDIWAHALNEHHKIAYRSTGVDLQFFKLMVQLAQDETQMEQLEEAILQHREKYRSEKRPTAPLLLIELSALEKRGETEDARQLMERNLMEPEVLQYAIQQAQRKGKTPRVKALAITGLRLRPPAEEKEKLEELLLQLSEKSGEQEDINHYARQRFLDTFDFSYYQKAKRAADSRWDEQVDEMLRQLRQLPYSPRRRDTIARMYAEEGRYGQLMNYAEEVKSLDLLQQFSRYLIGPERERLYALYRQLLGDFLKSHLGRKTSQRAREALAHLYQIGADDLAGQMIEEIRANYPERHSLMDELTLFE